MMICPYCGNLVDAEDEVCEKCGEILPRSDRRNEGVMAIRQGKKARQAASEETVPMAYERQGTGKTYIDPSLGEEDTTAEPDYMVQESTHHQETPAQVERNERKIYEDTYAHTDMSLVSGSGSRRHHKYNQLLGKRTNWMVVLLVSIVLLAFLSVGTIVFLQRSEHGQRILARMGREASADAYWVVGEERMDTGDIEGAIADFEKAVEKDGEENLNVSGVLMLASCYESIGDLEHAEAIYIHLYTDVVPSASEAYTHEVRILQSTGREAEAAELLKLAYERTGNSNFNRQRNELLPEPPVTSLGAGLYEEKKYVHLTSASQDDIYYTFDAEAILPEDGTLFTEDVFLDEGVWNMRAVSVRGSLVSDELVAVYRIIMPSPQTPYAMLAPATYQKRQRVHLRVGDENKDDTDITIYYTIDGSIPDADSPIYDGEGVLLPGGNSTLHAVAVNGYGKASNTLERKYKVEQRPWPEKSYTIEDTASGIVLNKTTWDDFRAAYGEGERMEMVTMDGLGDECRKHYYSWGYAVFYMDATRLFLCELYFTQSTFNAPRGTGIGDTENGVVSKFRDMGQVESPSGNRGLYYNDNGRGKIFVQENGGKLIRYVHNTADSHRWQLDYYLSPGGLVIAVDQTYIP